MGKRPTFFLGEVLSIPGVTKTDLEKAREVIEPIVRSLGFELVEIRTLTGHGRRVLQVLVDREGGVTIGDCQQVSREIETPLEVEAVVPGRYDLEVSSPGLNRPLVREDDYIRFAGKKVCIQTWEAIDGRRNYKGVLQGIEEGVVKILIEGQDYKIPYGAIEKAHLVFEGGK